MKVILIIAVCTNVFLTGCATLIGVKDYESNAQGTKIHFVTGYGTSATINGIDTVNDNRGIKPSKE